MEVEKIDTKRPLNLLKHSASMRRLSPSLSPDGSNREDSDSDSSHQDSDLDSDGALRQYV